MKNTKQEEEKTIYLKAKIKRYKPFTIKAIITRDDLIGETNTKGEVILVEIEQQAVYVDRLEMDFSKKTIAINVKKVSYLEIIVFLTLGVSIAVFVWAATSLF